MAEVRFAFGENWRSFLETLDEERIRAAEGSLVALLGSEGIRDRTFLDIGSGSGLSSLVACRLGAARVVSFDYDPASVACAESLRERYGISKERWEIRQGSALDEGFVRGLGRFDLVYSWGVLHHTGAMWRGVALAAEAVTKGGRLVLALYNDQGWQSRVWWLIKRTYSAGSRPTQGILLWGCAAIIEAGRFISRLFRFRDPRPWIYWRNYRAQRGMSVWHDYRDWVGGFPFEVASPAEVQRFFAERGFRCEREILVGAKMGCNEFVLVRGAA